MGSGHWGMCKMSRYRLREAPAEVREGRNSCCSGAVQLVVEGLRCKVEAQNWTKDELRGNSEGQRGRAQEEEAHRFA